ncbi:recombinase family protein [Paenibacillus thalictri]|uniref:Recombinase family protein n=1 Tax=Paenibacillus thalictri TaxID=2527873 RepID=A0A4V2J354_9BACL|nr:recombinase family protein [Paenibacillus thalictri]TBL69782.1 recombinase family protein [Paenibacillus thalictri]
MNVVIYLRVSSEQQAEKQLSIPAQREALQKFAEERGWRIVDEFVDEARSAKTADRPDFQRMIADAQKTDRTFQAVLVHKFDRFSRSREDHVVYKALLKKLGVFVFSATEPTEPETPHGVLLEGMLEVISEWYNVNLKFETLKGMRENAEQGFHCGGRAPFGYRLHRNGSKVNYILGPDIEVSIVKQIFQLAAAGNGGKKIARILNEQDESGVKVWRPSTVLSIIDNYAYCGHRIWNKKCEVTKTKNPKEDWIIKKNGHPAIIDEKLWIAAQSAVKSRKIMK